MDALPETWKNMIFIDKGNIKNLAAFDHHIVRKSQVCSFKKLNCKELYHGLLYLHGPALHILKEKIVGQILRF